MGMLGMVSLLLLMPVSYRAGTDTPHPHAFFQGAIELVSGEAHEHADGTADRHAGQDAPVASATQASQASQASISPFIAADIPLAAARQVTDADELEESSPPRASIASAEPNAGPDTPQLTDLKPALDQGSAIASIGMLLILVASYSTVRKLWFSNSRLTGLVSLLEPPPPRMTFCT